MLKGQNRTFLCLNVSKLIMSNSLIYFSFTLVFCILGKFFLVYNAHIFQFDIYQDFIHRKYLLKYLHFYLFWDSFFIPFFFGNNFLYPFSFVSPLKQLMKSCLGDLNNGEQQVKPLVMIAQRKSSSFFGLVTESL